MMGLKELRNNLELINAIDWEMTPEEAVTLYLEWGNNWTHGKNLVRSKNDMSYYFVVNTWDDPPRIYLVQRNSQGAIELATIHIPDALKDRFLKSIAHNKGVYPLNEELRGWLEKELHNRTH